jgi:hypothetical protein
MYGYVRGLLGAYYGFLCAMMELYLNISTLAYFLVGFGGCCNKFFGFPTIFQLVFYPILFIISGLLHSSGKKYFYQITLLVTSLAILIYFLYLYTSIMQFDYHTYANEKTPQANNRVYAETVINWSGTPSLFFCGEYLLPALVGFERSNVSELELIIIIIILLLFVLF